jgi:phage terminase large subunit-like protein
MHQVIRLREGEWHQEGNIWKHDRGGLLLPGNNGETYYRWLPFQIFVLAAMYGANAWVDTEVSNGTRELLPSEREGENGTIEDLRRLCVDFTYFLPRKSDKTGLSAYNNFLYFMLEDADSEIYCCANSQSQSRLLYDRTVSLIRQMDPQGRRIRFTSTSTNWKPGQIRSAQLYALSAGGKAKDGLKAQLCCADEFGSAPYVNGKSDMGVLVNVVLSSMGPRRNPMIFTSTTAGNIITGPFIDKLNSMKNDLLNELDIEEPKVHDGRLLSPGDRWMILPTMPDEWQLDEETLLTSVAVRKKVNPTLGIITQNAFYEQAVADSRLDPLKKMETISKLFNVYTFSKVDEWIKPDVIRGLQVEGRKVDDCKASDGWVVFCGMDFSMGDDLYAHGYLCVNVSTGDLFADLDAWITQETLEKISIRALYEKWIADGWLHVCPGSVIDTEVPVNRIISLTQNGVNSMRIGFDPYRSPDPVNMLKAWVHSLGLKPDEYVVPVSQTNATYNLPTEQLTQIVKHPRGSLRFSANPLWPYCFGCCVLEKDNRMENKKPVKRNPGSDACKVDPIQALLSAWICWNRVESSEIQTD